MIRGHRFSLSKLKERIKKVLSKNKPVASSCNGIQLPSYSKKK
jgi:phosphoribosylformylglycinamidine (FGAM) synthase-like amidotransferase family enzyme